jgi:hypothetical protein
MAVEAKAARLLVGASAVIRDMCVGHVVARVDGDRGTYNVTHDGRRWSCDCAAVGPCSHAPAVAPVGWCMSA